MLERISDDNFKMPCLSPEHNPPSHIVLQLCRYVPTCPSCGESFIFTVGSVWMNQKQEHHENVSDYFKNNMIHPNEPVWGKMGDWVGYKCCVRY